MPVRTALAVALVLFLAPPAIAQDAAPDATAADLLALDRALEVLQDDARRQALAEAISSLRSPPQAAADPPPAGPLETLTEGIGRTVAALPGRDRLLGLKRDIGRALAEGRTRIAAGRPLLPPGSDLALALPGWGLALAVWIAAGWATAGRRDRIAARACAARTWGSSLFLALRHAVLSLVPVLCAAAATALWPFALRLDGAAAGTFLLPAMTGLAAGLALAMLGWLYLLVALAARRPSVPRPRPLVGWTAATATAARLVAGPAGRAALGPGIASLASLAIDLVAAVLALLAIHAERPAIRFLLDAPSATPAADPPTATERAMAAIARNWHRLAAAFVLLNLLARLGSGARGDGFLLSAGLSVAALLAAFALTLGVERAHAALLARMGRTGPESLRLALAMRTGHVLRMAVQAGIFLAALTAVLSAWGLEPLRWSTGQGAPVLRPLAAIAAVILAVWLVRAVIDALAAWSLSRHPSGSASPSARARTLVPLLRNAALVALAVIGTILVLSNLGLDVTPLLAGAGVAGLAIGFGAQQLVRDVITGLFLIAEDAIAVGETVEAAGKTGTVEGLTIRTLRLRDGDGALHSIPFSSVTTLRNTSRGYGVYTVSAALAPGADVDAALAALRDVASETAADPAFAGIALAPFDLWGVDQISPTGIIIKGTLRTAPGKQWALGREVNRRLTERLRAQGIPLAGSSRATAFGIPGAP